MVGQVLGVDVGVLGEHALLLAGDQHRGEEALLIVVQRLPPPVVVDAGPADHRPAVVELPHDGAHAAPAMPSPVLHAVLHGLGLQQLGGVDEGVEGGGIEVGLGQVFGDAPVGGGVALVLLHDVGEGVAVLRLGEALDGVHAGEGLEAELRGVAEQELPVLGEGLQAVPHVPVVHVAALGVLGLVEAAAAGGAGGPVEGVRVLPLHDLRQDVLVHLDVVRHLLLLGDPVARGDEALHFVVAAPDGQGRMVAQAADVVLKLGADARLEVFAQVVHGAGEHEVLPHQQAQLVADVIEEVVGIVPAAPDAHGVHVGQTRVLQQPPRALGGAAAQQVVLGDVIRAHREDLHAVDDVAEVLAGGVLFAGNGERPKADAALPAVQLHAVPGQPDLHGVHRLVAEARGPPELGILDFDCAFRAVGEVAGAVGGLHVHVHLQRAAAPAGDAGVDVQGDPAVFMTLAHQHVADAGAVPADEHDVPPDAAVGQPRTPVPAEHAVGLAQVGEALHGVAGPLQPVRLIRLADVFGGRGEGDGDGVFAGLQQGLHVELPGAVHVVRHAGQLAVDLHRRQGVQALAAQIHPLAAKQVLAHLKGPGVAEIVLHPFEGFHLVVPPEGVLDLSRREQIAVHAARHSGLQARQTLVRHVQRPCPVQGKCLHIAASHLCQSVTARPSPRLSLQLYIIFRDTSISFGKCWGLREQGTTGNREQGAGNSLATAE